MPELKADIEGMDREELEQYAELLEKVVNRATEQIEASKEADEQLVEKIQEARSKKESVDVEHRDLAGVEEAMDALRDQVEESVEVFEEMGSDQEDS